MGYYSDLQDIVRNIRSHVTDVKDTVSSNMPKSITRRALEGTLQFPCLVSDSISIEMASTIARTLERVYASFVQAVLSTNNTIDISVDKNPNLFLKKFHKNIKLESTVEDTYYENCIEEDSEYDALMERVYNGTSKMYINESCDTAIVFNFNENLTKEVFESNKKGLEEALAGIDFKPFPIVGNSPFYEAPRLQFPSYQDYLNSNPGDPTYRGYLNNQIAWQTDLVDRDIDIANAQQAQQHERDIELQNLRNAQSDRAANRDRAFQAGTKVADMVFNVGNTFLRDKLNKNATKAQQAQQHAYDTELQKMRAQNSMDQKKWELRNSGDLGIPTLMKDNDVKKSNDLQPYGMQVRLMAINDKNEFVQFMDFIVGVKVVLHCIKSNEMIVNVQNALNNNGFLFNFIRWTTGEKSLFKDLALNINNTKLDIANKSKGASPWWSTLKRLKETSRAQLPLKFFDKTKLVPQSTIVLSSFDTDAIEKMSGYNLRDPKFGKKLMNALFLMNLVIVDEGTGTLEVLYDGENSYQTYTLEALQREISMNSNKLGKELTRMLSR